MGRLILYKHTHDETQLAYGDRHNVQAQCINKTASTLQQEHSHDNNDY